MIFIALFFAILIVLCIFIDDIINLFRTRCCKNRLNLKTIGRAKEMGHPYDNDIIFVEKCSVCGLEYAYRISCGYKSPIELEYAKERLGLPINPD
jgi:hypothetical protein